MSEFSRQALSPQAVQDALPSIQGWEYADNAISRMFEFKSFREAMSFIMRIAFEAEELDHHPELSNVYNKVGVTLRTHDANNNVTSLDIELARRINHLSWI
ncbi:MAG: 4a-hydroxytetrahydrobiopterin dehydratase [Bacteroidetes bacterium]|nr:4a-hydroxytetrahydrobiopterin dehydratase [Bacteroidota bacterium]MDA1333791.1 4a-hydroxytetrahydrobiopterin dehydratase [Bacteroidota bacterium]